MAYGNGSGLLLQVVLGMAVESVVAPRKNGGKEGRKMPGYARLRIAFQGVGASAPTSRSKCSEASASEDTQRLFSR
jgi:hypothetical protein